jgi:dUTP pyrophosphatase
LQSNAPRIEVALLPHAHGLPIPTYMSDGAAGADVTAAIADAITLAVGARALVPTGLLVAIPPGYEIQVRPRSGLAFKHGVTVLNAPGTIDADYRGEIGVLLVNLGAEPFTVRRGDRIAQLVVAAAPQAVFAVAAALGETARDAGGFGSTGA